MKSNCFKRSGGLYPNALGSSCIGPALLKRTTLLLLLFAPALFATDQEKAERKALEQQAKTFIKEAKDLEKAGNFLAARKSYATSQSFVDTKQTAEAIKRIDVEIRKRIKDALHKARGLYDQGNFKAAADSLEQAVLQTGSSPMFSLNLGLCYQRLGDRALSLAHLDQAVMGIPDPKRKLKIRQLRTSIDTGEQFSGLKNEDLDRLNKINQLMERIGFEASLDEAQPALLSQSDVGSPALRNTVSPVTPDSRKPALRSVSLCQTLNALQGPLSLTPSMSFNLANCAELNDRPADAAKFLTRYLESSPKASDAERVRLRILRLKELAGFEDQKGAKVRSLYGSAARSLESREYGRALQDLQQAALASPDFAPTQWRLALMHEGMGNVELTRRHFGLYRQLEANATAQQEADLHLETLDAKRNKYDEEVGLASEILSDLFNRAMNLTFNGLEDRASQYKRRAKERARVAAKQKVRMVGGFTIPFAYAQQQLAEAGEHLASALVLFPLGAEANQLMGLVYLQANDGRSAMRSFDVVASQKLPVAFYAEMRGRNKDHAVKCELTRDRLRLIYLSSYDKKAKPLPPAKPAGEDGLGDLFIDPFTERQQDFESLTLETASIKKMETKNGHLLLKLAKEDLTLSPIYLPAPPPSDGPAARRFGNNYTRLFVRYPGMEESKLGNEGLTGYEKVKLGYDIANAAYGIAGSLNPIGAIGALQTFVQISREIHTVTKSLQISFAAWIRTIEDQQDLQSGNSFKPIPTEPTKLNFVEELK